MGATSVFLMMAAIGITYGWQPDGAGGVEYVIQVPPDQVNELQRIGELSSVIDPAVRGHVSRVIIRIGTDSPPRITPRNLSIAKSDSKGAAVAASDETRIPIPEISVDGRAVPIRGVATPGADATKAAMMKPQTGDVGGFGMPPSLGNTATSGNQPGSAALNTVDRAGREFGTRNLSPSRSSAANVRGPILPPPATRIPEAPNAVQTPPFTGGSTRTDVAGTRAGGPSTEPADARDRPWQDLTVRPSNASGPSTDPIAAGAGTNPFRFSTADGNATNAGDANRLGPNGLRAGETFGRPPTGLQLPNTPASQSAGNVAAVGNPTANARGLSQYEQSLVDGGQLNRNNSLGERQAAANSFRGVNQNAQSQWLGSNSLGNPPGGNQSVGNQFANGQYPNSSANNPYANSTNNSTSIGQAGFPGSSGYGNTATPNTQSLRPDPRLSPAQVAAGAWLLDEYNRPLDRYGRLLVSGGALDASRSWSRSGAGGADPQASLGQPSAQSQLRSPVTDGSPGGLDSSRRMQPLGEDRRIDARTNLASDPRLSEREQIDRQRGELLRQSDAVPSNTSSISERRASSVAVQPQRVAAQPFFNGLLLISFVANVYLIFWLRNLHHKYREMVAAKRLANSSNAA